MSTMPVLTAKDIIDQIDRLTVERPYQYVGSRSTLEIVHVTKPEGPVTIRRNGQPETSSISREQLAKIAIYCTAKPNYPLHVDRLFSGGGNTRSALETLLAYTPNFFICYPRRVDINTGEILDNQKHIMWCPDEHHELGQIARKDYNFDISDAMDLGVEFDKISIEPLAVEPEFSTPEAKRTHVQMQIALIEIGRLLNFETWVAKNDQAILVGNNLIRDLPGVIQSIDEVSILHRSEMKERALFIDCIWFAENKTRIPAVIEIEHSTGVTSGLTRMSKFRDTLGDIVPTFTIVAPNQLRGKVVSEANDRHFRSLNARFMPYSVVRELYSLVKRYPLNDTVNYRFVRAFMETVVQ